MNFPGGGISFYKNFAAEKRGRAEINITPLIDVIFMLVVFFMIGASFEKPAIALSLPKASSGETGGKTMLTVSVDAQGAVFFEGAEIDLLALSARLAEYGGPAEDLSVALECDGAAVFDRVVLVMDSIKNAGVRNVAIRHEPK